MTDQSEIYWAHDNARGRQWAAGLIQLGDVFELFAAMRDINVSGVPRGVKVGAFQFIAEAAIRSATPME